VFAAMDRLSEPPITKGAPAAFSPAGKKFSNEDKVFFYDKDNQICRGTVRWLGASKTDDAKVVGIEAVSGIMVCKYYHDNESGFLIRI